MPDLRSLFERHQLPLDAWIQHATDWLVLHLRGFFVAVRWPVANTLEWFDGFLRGVPVVVFLAFVFLIAWRINGIRAAGAYVAGLLLIGFLGLWDSAMTTLAMVVTSVIFCVLVGVPVGVLAGRSRIVDRVLRPILDAMQTTPTFVYLVPIVMFFGIGTVPGVIATIIVAIPPIIRLTALGIRQVQEDLVEAGYAFGSTPNQVLREIQLPLALPMIMAGLNQTLMLSLSMVVMVALIGGGGLGFQVYSGINQLNVGLAGVSGLSIVVLAIILDRLTQAAVAPRPRLSLPFWRRQPADSVDVSADPSST